MVLEKSATQVVANPRRKRFRFGLRGLIGLVLLLGLVFGWIARENRRVQTQSAVIAELSQFGVRDGRHEPTLLCLIAMKFSSTDNRSIEARFSRYLDTGWFYRVRSFNAGMLNDEQVPAVVERLGRLGTVKEVYFNEPSLKGLRLYYIDRISGNLGPSKDSCTFRDYPPTGDPIPR